MDIFEHQVDGKLIHFRRYENGVLTRDVRYYQDGLQRRVAKEFIISNQTWTNTFAYLGFTWQLLFGQNGQGDRELFSDALGIDEHLGKIKSDGVLAFTTDQLGTVANELTSNDKKSMSPYGESFVPEITPSATTQAVTYGYTGRERDHESGLDHHRNRTRDPLLNLFLTEDPKGRDGRDFNLPRYVKNSPLMLIDPYGEDAVEAGLGALLAKLGIDIAEKAAAQTGKAAIAGVAIGSVSALGGIGFLLYGLSPIAYPSPVGAGSDIVPKDTEFRFYNVQPVSPCR